MSDAPIEQNAPVTPEGTTPPAPADTTPPADSAPKWDGEFDADRAARLIANLREENKGIKAQFTEVQTKLSQFEQSQMSDLEKVTARATTAEQELSKVRREMAVSNALTEFGLPKDAARFLTGETAEEISEAAKAFAALGVSKPADNGEALPPTLPVPGNGSDPAVVRQLTREEIAGMSNAQLLEAYRAGRLRDIGGK